VAQPTAWFAIRRDLPPQRAAAALLGGLLLPFVLWAAVSYVPFIWHPYIKIVDAGGSTELEAGMRVEPGQLATENARLAAAGKPTASGVRANPMFLPAPHEALRAVFTAFATEPVRPGDPWLHQSLLHSIKIIIWGFLLSALFGVPLGILCGTFAFFSRAAEPFTDFIRYMPAPAFGALAVAVLGIHDAPKVAIIFIGTYFQMVLVIANTTRLLDASLIEAAQTLGANRKQLLTKVVIPGIVPNLYNDLRILLGWAWTYLIVAELIGASSGISYFINQQGKYRNYDNVFAGIIIIGLVGLVTDQVLALASRFLFPWQPQSNGSAVRKIAHAARVLFRHAGSRRASVPAVPKKVTPVLEARGR
jgi:NitT/TauT family transport system permease protein